MRARVASGIVVLLGLQCTIPAQGEDLDRQAIGVLKKHCVRCHGPSSTNRKALKDIPNILDVKDVVAREKIAPGDPDKSDVWTQVRDGKMPDDAIYEGSPSDTEKETLKDWIVSLKAQFAGSDANRVFVSDGDVLKAIFEDIASVSMGAAADRRYLSITNLHNNPSVPDEELEVARQALTKMLNSLTWKRVILKPTPVDPEKTVFRVELSKLGWSKEQWEKIANLHPYNKFYDTIVARSLADYTGTKLSVIRADWFVAKLSKPPLYHEFAQIPATAQELEKKLLFNGLTADENLKANAVEVVRVGIAKDNSGVSAQNRLIERHPALYGAYWRSFDFLPADPADEKAARRDFFRHPTGPGGENGFLPDGGEYIFNLPNGFQAYMLTDGAGKRIDSGPVKVVFDQNAAAEGRNPEIVNGISCIGCHSAGIRRATDELLTHVQGSVFPVEVRETIELLHEPGKIETTLSEDEQRFVNAMKQAGVTNLSVSDEPVTKLVQRFEGKRVDLRTAAAELGLKEEQLKAKLDQIDSDSTLKGVKSQIEKGGMPREQFIAAFDALTKALGINRDDKKLRTVVDELKAATEERNAAAGKLAETNEQLNAAKQQVDQLQKDADRWAKAEKEIDKLITSDGEIRITASRSSSDLCEYYETSDKDKIIKREEINTYGDKDLWINDSTGNNYYIPYAQLNCIISDGYAGPIANTLNSIRQTK